MYSLVLAMNYYSRTMTSGWQGAPYFRRYGRELVSITGGFVKKKLRWSAAERLWPYCVVPPLTLLYRLPKN